MGGKPKPDWEALAELAAASDGLFTTAQAAECRISSQLLRANVNKGRFERIRRGIYRIPHVGNDENIELTEAWLWSKEEGVLSHQSALALHDVSDVLPSKIHLTVPGAWRTRRVKVPTLIKLHYGDISEEDKTWHGSVPITTFRRTLADAVRDNLPAQWVRQAVHTGIGRGDLRAAELIGILCMVQAELWVGPTELLELIRAYAKPHPNLEALDPQAALEVITKVCHGEAMDQDFEVDVFVGLPRWSWARDADSKPRGRIFAAPTAQLVQITPCDSGQMVGPANRYLEVRHNEHDLHHVTVRYFSNTGQIRLGHNARQVEPLRPFLDSANTLWIEEGPSAKPWRPGQKRPPAYIQVNKAHP